jgi:hypothetical protein
MLLESIAAVLVGIAGLLLVLGPLLRPTRWKPAAPEPLDPEETPRGIALTALKEIDFDRETGKLSESDYQFLKAKYTAAALEAMRSEAQSGERASAPAQPTVSPEIAALTLRTVGNLIRPTCRTCGPRPEPDAVFCSTCGLHLAATVERADSRAASAGVPTKPLQAS